MDYYVLTTEKFKKEAEELNEYLVKDLKVETHLTIVKDDLEYADKIIETSQHIIDNDRYKHSLIMIDETGGLGFVVSSKVKYMITAQCSDEHSSHMTREHNGAVGISLGAHLSSVYQMKSIMKYFVNEKFAAGRHMVRIDMLDDMA